MVDIKTKCSQFILQCSHMRAIAILTRGQEDISVEITPDSK